MPRGKERLLTDAVIGSLNGETFYWNPSICRIIESVASTIPDNWRLSAERLPAQRGFFWFDKPVLVDVDGVVPLPDILDAHGPSVYEAIGWIPGLSTRGDHGVILSAFTKTPGRPLYPTHHSSMWEVESFGDLCKGMIQETNGWVETLSGLRLVRLFAACLAFLEQRILIAPHQRAERHARKRLERQGLVYEPLIRVVELRRKQARTEYHGDAEPVEWSHQWIVSGHWRQQWYPSLNANQPVWIMPYVKGPEDKPLKPPRAKVFAVVR
jgi:hypothetical protein